MLEARSCNHLAVLMLANGALIRGPDDVICTTDVTGVQGIMKIAGDNAATTQGWITTMVMNFLWLEGQVTASDTSVAAPRGVAPLAA